MFINPQPMSDDAKTGERVLVFFTRKGWLTVTWDDPHGDGDYKIWCVDDDKHGPYPFRGYSEGDDVYWSSLPADPRPVAPPTPWPTESEWLAQNETERGAFLARLRSDR